MNKKLLLTFLISLLILTTVYADTIMPGVKTMHVGYKIGNLNDFSNYHFVLEHFEIMGGKTTYSLIEPNINNEYNYFKIRGYKFDSGVVYALPKAEISNEELNLLKNNLSTNISKSRLILNDTTNFPFKFTQNLIPIIKNLQIQSGTLEIDPFNGLIYQYKLEKNNDFFSYSKKTIRTGFKLTNEWFFYIIGGFILTVIIEFTLSFIFFKSRLSDRLKKMFIINTISYFGALIIYFLFKFDLIYLELLIFIAEIFLIRHYFKTKWFKSFIAALLLNLFSLVSGYILFSYLFFILF